MALLEAFAPWCFYVYFGLEVEEVPNESTTAAFKLYLWKLVPLVWYCEVPTFWYPDTIDDFWDCPLKLLPLVVDIYLTWCYMLFEWPWAGMAALSPWRIPLVALELVLLPPDDPILKLYAYWDWRMAASYCCCDCLTAIFPKFCYIYCYCIYYFCFWVT